MNFLGFNYRMTEFQAVMGYQQLIRSRKDLNKVSNAAFLSKLISKDKNIHCTNLQKILTLYFRFTLKIICLGKRQSKSYKKTR